MFAVIDSLEIISVTLRNTALTLSYQETGIISTENNLVTNPNLGWQNVKKMLHYI